MVFQYLHKSRTFRFIAIKVIFVLMIELINPSLYTYALTSGPSQPEATAFQTVSGADMVDLFTGDFKYNIPLFSIGGYPVALTYDANIGMDDEATWVGLGWNLNSGSVSRNLRGLPDDFKPEDKIIEVNSSEPSKTVSLGFSASPSEIFGKDFNDRGNGDMKYIGFTLFHNNYSGVGVSYEYFNNSEERKLFDVGSISLNSQQGASITPSLNLKKVVEDHKKLENFLSNFGYSPSLAAGLNSRTGVQYMSFGSAIRNAKNLNIGGNMAISFARPSTYMTPSPKMKNTSIDFQITLGGEGKPFKLKTPKKVPFSYNKQGIAEETKESAPYGYLYMNKESYESENAIMDIELLEDQELNRKSTMIGVPSFNYDLFSINSHNVSGQMTIKRGTMGAMGNPKFSSINNSLDDNINANLSIELGMPSKTSDFKVGVDLIFASSSEESGFWNEDANQIKGLADFEFSSASVSSENAYFKISGENHLSWTTDDNQYHGWNKDMPARVKMDKDINLKHNNRFRVNAKIDKFDKNYIGMGDYAISESEMHRAETNSREVRNKSVIHLTASEATNFGFQKKIQSYTYSTEGIPILNAPISYDRISAIRKAHHISEMVIFDEAGSRTVFGLPVYNTFSKEVSFSVGKAREIYGGAPRRIFNTNLGLVQYKINEDNKKDNRMGLDRYFSSRELPAYATAFLLTSVLSPDYEDVDQNGPTENDLGDYTKFNYSLTGEMQWRTPYNLPNSGFTTPSGYAAANYNPGMLSDDEDDKANYSYGKREDWYLHSMESKSEVALFYISKREDGLGADENGIRNETQRLMKLDKIEIYSKNEYYQSKQENRTAIPVKTVHFKYSYDLCPNVPNNSGAAAKLNDGVTDYDHPLKSYREALLGSTNGTYYNQNANFRKGKLTLNKVYFTYGANNRGEFNPYIFEYAIDQNNSVSNNLNPSFHPKAMDRWGSYMPQVNNALAYNGSDTSVTFYNQEFSFSGMPFDGYHGSDWNSQLDIYANAWKMNRITLPSGAKINVTYESDDYAYVQDRPATNMIKIAGFYNPDNNTITDYLFKKEGINTSQSKLLFYIDQQIVNQSELIQKYIPYENKNRHVFISALVNLNNSNKQNDKQFENISGFFEFDMNNDLPSADIITIGGVKYGILKLKTIDGNFNAITIKAYDYMLKYRPDLANPGSNIKRSETKVKDIALALFNFIPDVIKLFSSRDLILRGAKKGREIKASNSVILLKNPYYSKKGGGSRVKKIVITDAFEGNKTYGSEYDYKKFDKEKNAFISSGVAANEPAIGGQENAMRHVLNSFIYEKFDLESKRKMFNIPTGPVGEQFYPGANVGYSQVTVRSLYNEEVKKHQTGRSVSEFYTAKDFPTFSSATELEKQKSIDFTQIVGQSRKFLSATQGFLIETNNMHGKPKANWEYKFKNNGNNDAHTFAPYPVEEDDGTHKEILISGSEYKYFTHNNSFNRLNNEVNYLDPSTNTIKKGLFGVDIDLFLSTDQKETVYSSKGVEVNLDVNSTATGVAIPAFTVWPKTKKTLSKFQTVSLTKIVRRSGIPWKTIVHQDGAKLETENLAFDPLTGSPLLVKTQTQFNDKYEYQLNVPAHWASEYKRMGPSYKNIGLELTNYSITDGKGANTSLLLTPGDELIDVAKNIKLWVLDAKGSQVSFIDGSGNNPGNATNYNLKLIRSGNKNLIGNMIATLVHDNADRTKLNDVFYDFENTDPSVSKILNAGITEYSEDWNVGAIFEDCNSGLAKYYLKMVDLELGKCVAKVLKYQLENHGYYTEHMKVLRENEGGNSLSHRNLNDSITIFENGKYYFGFNAFVLAYMQEKNTGITSSHLFKDKLKPQINSVRVKINYSTGHNLVDPYDENYNKDAKVNGTYLSINNTKDCQSLTGCCKRFELNTGNEYDLGGYIAGLEIRFEAYSELEQVFNCLYILNFDVIHENSSNKFVTFGLMENTYRKTFFGNVGNVTRGFFDFGILNTNLTTTTVSGDNDILNYSPPPISSGNYCYIGCVSATEFAVFIDEMLSCSDKQKNAIWRDYIFTDYNNNIHTVMNNSEYAKFGTFHSEVDINNGFTVSLNNDVYHHNGPKIPNKYTIVMDYITSGNVTKHFILNRVGCNDCIECPKYENPVNPYLAGIRGKWVPVASRSYFDKDEGSNRNSSAVNYSNPIAKVDPNQSNIKSDGFYDNFREYLKYNSGSWTLSNTAISYWPHSDSLKQRTPNGEQILSNNALNIKSAALYGYKQDRLVKAVAQNASIEQIANINFEEYKFNTDLFYSPICAEGGTLEFDQIVNGGTISLSTNEAHSGLTSLKLEPMTTELVAEALVCRKRTYPSPLPSNRDADLSEITGAGLNINDDLLTKYRLKQDDAIPNFAPHKIDGQAKKYVLSYWVKESSTDTLTFKLIIGQNNICDNSGTNLTLTPIHSKITIEGWTKKEFYFTINDDTELFKVYLKNQSVSGGNGQQPVYLDDVRIFPYDANMKTFVYNPYNMRLMAQLDENNFATFFEYDSEGNLIRTKVETERGIFSTSENRKNIKQILKEN